MNREQAQLVEQLLRDEQYHVEIVDSLTAMGIPVTPVWGIEASRRGYSKDKEKLPYMGYSSRKYIDEASPIEEIDKLWSRNRIGMAICPTHSSGLIIIDVDKPEEVEFFRGWFEFNTGLPLPPPTVRTPGVIKGGEDIHKDGGHYYFALPDGWNEGYKLKSNGIVKSDDGRTSFLIKSEGGYVIAPPTVRTEGAYEFSGGVYLAEDYGLTEAFLDALGSRKSAPLQQGQSYAPELEAGENSRIAKIKAWTKANDWSQILPYIGLEERGGNSCGRECSRFRDPDGTSDTQGVAHREGCGCSHPDTITVFSSTTMAKLGIDNQGSLSMWQAVVNVKYNGNTQDALIGEGLYSGTFDELQEKRRKRVITANHYNAMEEYSRLYG